MILQNSCLVLLFTRYYFVLFRVCSGLFSADVPGCCAPPRCAIIFFSDTAHESRTQETHQELIREGEQN